jgi:hypothetical protein
MFLKFLIKKDFREISKRKEVNRMKKIFFCLSLTFIVLAFILSSGASAGQKEEAEAAFGNVSNLYIFCNYAGAQAYDVYNFTLGEKYYKEAEKALKKEKNYEKVINFSKMAMPHLKIVYEKYVEAQQ